MTTAEAVGDSVLSLAAPPRRQPPTTQLRAAKVKQILTFFLQRFLFIKMRVLLSW
jgi:trans-2-enoyl-CoA reductase